MYAILYSSSNDDNGWYLASSVEFSWCVYSGMTVDDTGTRSITNKMNNACSLDVFDAMHMLLHMRAIHKREPREIYKRENCP